MTGAESTLTIDYLKDCFSYNPITGILRWKKRPLSHFKNLAGMNIFNANYDNRLAGSEKTLRCGKRYNRLKLKGKMHQTHRIMWAIFYGEFPKYHIDHIDGNGLNNKIENLRSVTKFENMRNIRLASNNTSGYTGVMWVKKENRWVAFIRVDGRQLQIGSYLHIEDAAKARALANIKYGYHENHGSDRPL